MNWKDEGYLLSKTNFGENSIIIETFTLDHGKYSGIVYGGSSKKQKKKFQIGNKILLNLITKNVNKMGYFNVELMKPIAPLFFEDKKKSICILSSSTILRILLPERQTNKKIYRSFEELINQLNNNDWIKNYIYWELSLIKHLGYEINFLDQNRSINNTKKTVELNGKYFKIPQLLLKKNSQDLSKPRIKEALIFNKSLLMENFILPNRLKFPLSRNILEHYYN